MIVYTIPLNNLSLKNHFFKRQIRILTYKLKHYQHLSMNDENFVMELNENIFSSEDSNQVDGWITWSFLNNRI